MREPQEVERLRLAETLSMPIRNCGSAELDEPRLVGMKGEPEACEPCLKTGKELLCFVPMLEADDRVVRPNSWGLSLQSRPRLIPSHPYWRVKAECGAT
jgi:hypothetical protein